MPKKSAAQIHPPPFMYRGFRIVKRGPDHYTIQRTGFSEAWVKNLDEAMAVVDEML